MGGSAISPHFEQLSRPQASHRRATASVGDLPVSVCLCGPPRQNSRQVVAPFRQIHPRTPLGALRGLGHYPISSHGKTYPLSSATSRTISRLLCVTCE
jgi:hypothetical protein